MNKYVKIVLYSIISSLFVVLYSSLVSNISLSPIMFSILFNTLVFIQLSFLLARIIDEMKCIYAILKQVFKLKISRHPITLELVIIAYRRLELKYVSNKRKTLCVIRC